tara:strand:- start:318 stop:479 length:162 start_codon:yes stop_codon:yes gene_type:complete
MTVPKKIKTENQTVTPVKKTKKSLVQMVDENGKTADVYHTEVENFKAGGFFIK